MKEEYSNRKQWFLQYCSRTEQGVFKPRIEGVYYECPCCGYLILNGRGKNEICPLCNWEDDGQDDPHADEVWGGPNYYLSLTAARKNFSKHLISLDPRDKRFEIHNSEIIKEAKRKMMATYDVMCNETDEEKRGSLLKEIEKTRQFLREETHRRFHEYREQQFNGKTNP